METFIMAKKAYFDGALFVAFDIETTGLDLYQDQIVEIGALKFDKNGLIARFSTLIDPGIPMPPEATMVNKINNEMLKGKPSLDEVFPDFIHFIQNTFLTAHNAPFDCGFINAKLRKHREKTKESKWIPPYPALPNPIIDTLVLSREIYPGQRSYSLQNMALTLRIPVLNAHRAEDDARLCMEIFLACLNRKVSGW